MEVELGEGMPRSDTTLQFSLGMWMGCNSCLLAPSEMRNGASVVFFLNFL